jgi:hypothetical protein
MIEILLLIWPIVLLELIILALVISDYVKDNKKRGVVFTTKI